jgi:CRP-like cAMP-binding protein
LDIIQSFITTYLDKEGQEIWDKKQIAKSYIYEGMFMVDVISTIPFDYFGGPELLAMLGLMKLARLGRISIIIARLNVNEQIKALIKMGQLTFYLYLVIHILGCIWFWIVKQNKKWIPPFDFIVLPPGTSIYTEGIVFQYWASIYNAIIMLASNEIGPRTEFEYFFVSVMMIAGALINANIFGEMAVLAQVMTKKQVKFQEQVDTANTAMKNLDIGTDVQQEVRDYFLFTQVTLDEQQELEKFLLMLSPSLKLEVIVHIFAKLMKKKLLAHQSKADQTIRFLVMKLVTVLSVPEDIFFRQDDESNDMYFIAKGECTVNVRDYKKREHKNFKILKPGDHFGEISLIYGCRRTATVASRNYSTLGKISKDLVLQIQSDNPGFLQHLMKMSYHYRDPNKKFITAAMKKIEFFNGISEAVTVEAMHSFRKSTYKAGTILFKQDQNADFMTIVYEGIVEFYTHFEGSEFVLERLYPGSLYNFRTFFMEDLMYVNARCQTNVALLEISKESIEGIMNSHDDFKRKMLSYQNQILKFEKTYPLDYLVAVPKEFQENNIYSEVALKRDNAFKNAIMRRIIEIRMEKLKPKLSDLLKMFEGKDLSNPKEKEALKKRIYDLYETTDDDKNSNYYILNDLFERINKVLSHQQAAFNKIDKRITKLQKDFSRRLNSKF